MVEIKDAVDRALEFARASLGPERTRGALLEEIESSTVEERPVWLITLSTLVQGIYPNASEGLARALGSWNEREYKIFTVTKDTGEVLSMKIRQLSALAS